MRQVSIKDFQSNVYLHVKDLPIEITKYGTPIFWVVGQSPENTVEKVVGKVATKKEIPVHSPDFCEISEANPNVMCSRVPHAKYKITYTGGDEPVSWELWLCEAHSVFQGGDVEVKKI